MDNRVESAEKEVVMRGTRVRFILSEQKEWREGLEAVDVYLLCFSLEDPASLLNSVGVWYPRVRGTGTPLILVGCKSDVSTIAMEEIRAISSQVQAADYIETSSKLSGQSINAMFGSIYTLCAPGPTLSPGYRRRSRSSRRDISSARLALSHTKNSKDCLLAGGRDSSLLSCRSKTGSLSSVSTRSKSSTLSSTKSDSSMISISTKTPRLRRRGGEAEAERMVTIRCERLTSEREYEQVEIEIPLSVYNNMQTQSNPLADRNATNRKSLVNRIKNMFI